MRRGSVGVLVALVALAAAAIALAGGPEQKKLTVADQAAARAASIHRADLKPAAGWTGGYVAPDLSGPVSCPNYSVDLSKYVLTGAASTQWRRGVGRVISQTEILKTSAMVAAEWRLQVTAPGAIPCLRSTIEKSLAASGARLVSFTRVRFPRIAPYTIAFRLVLAATVQGVTLREEVEQVILGKGRAEVQVTVGDAATAQSDVAPYAEHYARLLIKRVKA